MTGKRAGCDKRNRLWKCWHITDKMEQGASLNTPDTSVDKLRARMWEPVQKIRHLDLSFCWKQQAPEMYHHICRQEGQTHAWIHPGIKYLLPCKSVCTPPTLSCCTEILHGFQIIFFHQIKSKREDLHFYLNCFTLTPLHI